MVFSLPWSFPAFGQTLEFEAAAFVGMVIAIVCGVGFGACLYWFGRNETGVVLRKEALAIVGLGWVVAGIVGALPYLFTNTQRQAGIRMSVPDAIFESVSGFTTTGASVLTRIENQTVENPDSDYQQLVPRCVLFWRSFTHWLGGMGIIVLFVAILGQLGAGGKALMRREVPGPITEGVRPRVRDTAVVMWAIYVGLSVVLAVVLILEGMSLYDALCHTFGTMATGGFSTKDASVGSFESPLIEGTLVIFMIAAGTNFSLYYLVIRPRDTAERSGFRNRIGILIGDPEFRSYLSILAVATLLLTISLIWNSNYGDFRSAFRHAVFNSVAIMTTTGFGTEDFTEWSQFSKALLMLLMFIGGCSGSTGGGIKVIRWIMFARVLRLEVEQAFRPNVVRPLRIGGTIVDPVIRHEVMVYFSLILFIFISSSMVLSAIEPNALWQREGHTEAEKLIDCASAVAATLNNIGPGLGVLGPHSNYTDFSPQGKLLLTMLMLAGRLELFAILVLFVPSFWRNR